MDDDWESLVETEDVAVPVPPKVVNDLNKWDGEDEEEDVKESWEDEEEKKDEEKIESQISAKAKPKKPLQNKSSEKDRQQQELEKKLARERIENMTPEEKLAEKLRLQEIEKEQDLKNALDTFGVEPPHGLDAFHPTNKTEFSEFAQALSDKLSFYKTAEEFPCFVEDLVRSICANLNASDLKKIKITVENLHLEKLKLEKEKTKKPSAKGKTKIKLRVEEDDIQANNIGGDYGYDNDYDDFM